MFRFVPNQIKSIPDMLELILQAKSEFVIEGITCLGGEPFDQALPYDIVLQQDNDAL